MIRSVQSLLFCCVLSQSLSAAVTQVTLARATNPSSGQPGVGYVSNQNAVSIVNTTFQNPLTVGPYSVTRVEW
jgi:hypothetical protein